MGIKYHMEVKDHKLDQRFQKRHPTDPTSTPQPGMRAPKKLTRREIARLAAKPPPPKAS